MAWQERGKTPPAPLWPGREAAERLPGQYIFLTREQDAIIALIPAGETGAREETRISLHNQLLPAIQMAVIRVSPEAVRYTYRVANRAGAKDPIGEWRVILPAEAFLISKNDILTGADGEVIWRGTQNYLPMYPQVELGAPDLGRCYYWVPETEKDLIAAGTVRDGFFFNASYLPGFTTAYFSAYERVSIPDDWPAGAQRQVIFLDDLRWTQKMRLSIGPMFAPESKLSERATNFERGIERWISSDELARASPFVEDAGKALQAIAEGRPDVPPLRVAPSTERERELATALTLSLGLQIPPGSTR